MRRDHPTEELSVTRIVEFLRAETEARERIAPTMIKPEAKWRSPSLNHFTGAGPSTTVRHQTSTSNMVYSGPCMLGCGVHHKFVDCPVFQRQQPWQRRETMKAAGRCYNCFSRHKSSECKKTKQCSDCGGRHHRMLNCLGTNPPVRGTSMNAPSTEHLFSTSQMNPESTSFTPHTRPTSMTPTPTHGHVVSQNDTRRFSPTTYVEICDADGAWHQIVASVDSGSDTTLTRSSLAQRLGIAGKSEFFRYGVAGGGSKLERSTRCTLQVRPVHVQSVRGYALEAMGIRKPAHNAPAFGEMVFNDFPYLRPAQGCLPLAGAEIDLLVGYDHAYLITAVHTISAPTRSEVCLSAAYTRLGWTLFGGLIPKPRAIVTNSQSIHHVQRLEEEDLKSLFYCDVVGVKPTSACVCSDKELAEAKFLKHAKATPEITDKGRIRVSMPWRDGFPEALPFNKAKTVARMFQQENALKRKDRLESYNQEIYDLLTQGFVRPLTPEESNDGRGWYLEHHAVYREDKGSTKVRIVWNAAAQFQGVSLNDAFHKGPDLLNSLMSCLLAWRRDRVALVGDVRKMFNQIEVAASDQIYHRFVWRFGDENSPPRAFQWLRLPFGDRPAPDIATNSVRMLAEIARKSEPVGSHIVDKEMYMDDISHSTNSAEAALQARHEVDAVLARGKFETKAWNSNHPTVDTNHAETIVDVLGHRWNKEDDTFTLKPRSMQLEVGPLTKRAILGLVAKM